MKQKKTFYRFVLSVIFLMMGITQGWARTTSYTVEYVGVPTGQTGGYTVIDDYLDGSLLDGGLFSYGYISSGDNANPLVVENTLALEAPPALTTSNILTHIKPKEINGYFGLNAIFWAKKLHISKKITNFAS